MPHCYSPADFCTADHLSRIPRYIRELNHSNPISITLSFIVETTSVNLCVNSCNLACVCHSFLSHVGCTGTSFALLAGGFVRLRSAADVFAVACCRLDSLLAAVAAASCRLDPLSAAVASSSCVDRKAAKCHHFESLPFQPQPQKFSDVHTFAGFSFFAYFSVCSRARRSKSGRLFLYSADWWRDERKHNI